VVLTILLEALRELDFDVRLIAGRKTGGHLLANRNFQSDPAGSQLLLGHCDTVWPLGTIKEMAFSIEDNVIRGPGVFDMKGGITQMIYALKAIRELDLNPHLEPVIFINSDEEIGSVESRPEIERLAGQVERVFVLEPAYGRSGKLKTARKGVGRFEINVTGRAAHAGLEPEKGISAILELSYLIQRLNDMNDIERGISVNVGTIEGGTRPNVVAPNGRAVVDVRVPLMSDAEQIESAISGLQPMTPGILLDIRGGMNRPPLERTDANRKIWRLAKIRAEAIGLQLDEAMAGGGSDGNITSQYTATLDGLGSVGDGAHATHEFIFADKMIERSTLLAYLLLEPSLD
jgi:glutamate carboxypeptidase